MRLCGFSMGEFIRESRAAYRAVAAGVWPACSNADFYFRIADLVAANGLEQTIRGIRHVAVVTKAAA